MIEFEHVHITPMGDVHQVESDYTSLCDSGCCIVERSVIVDNTPIQLASIVKRVVELGAWLQICDDGSGLLVRPTEGADHFDDCGCPFFYGEYNNVVEVATWRGWREMYKALKENL
jgi:hypothetical protein